MKYFPVFFFLVICTPIQAQRSGYLTPEKIYQFATYLYQEGDYFRAAGEFQRYLFASDSMPANADSIFYKIGLCYRLGRDFPKGVDYFHKIIDDFPGSPLVHQTHYQIALSYFLMNKYTESTTFLNSNPCHTNQDIKLKMERLITLNYIYKKEWKEAAKFFNGLDTNAKNDSTIILLTSFTKETRQLSYKNRFIAGLLSSIVPGSGKMYCSRFVDGLFSLLTIGSTAWQAYDGFHKDGARSVKGWIFSSISGVFYLGNIYGSVVAAQIYNEEQEENLLNRVKLSIHVNFD